LWVRWWTFGFLRHGVSFSETLVSVYESTWRHDPEEQCHHIQSVHDIPGFEHAVIRGCDGTRFSCFPRLRFRIQLLA
jgi:hypothetical protein